MSEFDIRQCSGVGSLQAQVDNCVAAYAVNPNFMLVDVSVERWSACANWRPYLLNNFGAVLRVWRRFRLPSRRDTQRRNVQPSNAHRVACRDGLGHSGDERAS